MPLCEASASELDMVLQNLLAELKKKDGTDYEPESLRTMLAALDRFLRSRDGSGDPHLLTVTS